MGTKLEISKVRQENLQLYAHNTLQNISDLFNSQVLYKVDEGRDNHCE